MNKLKITCFLLAVPFFFACKHNESGSGKELARVGYKSLYDNQVQYPKGMNDATDSLAFLKVYVDKWIKKELVLQKAIINLGKSNAEIDKLVEEYKSSLLIHAYQQELMNQKMDTAVTKAQIDEYYNQHLTELKTDSVIVKIRFIKVPRNFATINQLRRLIKTSSEDELGELEKICFQNNLDYQFSADWMYFSDFAELIPRNINNPEQFIKSNSYHEYNDDQYFYLSYITDYRLVNDIAPVELVEQKIRQLILQKRKIQFIKEIENNIYNDALGRHEFINNLQ